MKDSGVRSSSETFYPVGRKILVRLVSANRSKRTAEGVVWAEVVDASPGRPGALRDARCLAVTSGDRVAIKPGSATAIVIDGEQLAIVDAGDVLGTLKARASGNRSAHTANVAEPNDLDIEEPSSPAREETLETDVAPDVLDHAEPTADDLH